MKYTVPALYDESTVDAANDMEIGEGNTECIEDDRIDLRLLNVFTIDPPDAKDLDDAISLKRTSDGFRVGVHIADVSSVVPKDSHIDVEAQHRATTFCPPSSCRPRHMLPEPLGTDMCSLLENKNRRAISVFFSFADDGTLNKTDNSSSIDIKRTMVRSRKQFTYKEIQTIIETPDTDTKDDIARDFSLRRRGYNNRKYMEISERNKFELICCDEMHPLQSVIYQDWISLQERAEYVCSSSVREKANGEHYDLNIYPYTHFTSPLRRYADLLIHRILRAMLFSNQQELKYVTTTPVDGYDEIDEYVRTWLPILRMESATNAVRNEESCYVNDVPVTFKSHREGFLSLCYRKCKDRNTIFSGERKETDDEPSSWELPPSYDWLCLRKVETIASNQSKLFIAETLNNSRVWVEHAEIIAVKTDKYKQLCSMCSRQSTSNDEVCGEIRVCFHLNLGSARSWDTWDTIDVELLKKSKVDRSGTQDIFPLPPNNKKQKEAIDKAPTSAFSLIQGSPGTGKTYTGIKLLYLFDKINKMIKDEDGARKQILFCGPSNKAIDVVANLLLQKVPEEFRPSFVRVYSQAIETLDFPIPRRSPNTRGTRNQNAPSGLRQVALHHIIRQDDKRFADEIKRMDKLFQNKKYTPSYQEVDEYLKLILNASIHEIRQYSIILCTTVVASNYAILKETNVYQVIIDEAGMCPEPQCLIPIIATNAKQVVLIGDHKQLRPIIICKEAGELGLSKSLFERYAMTDHSEGVEFTMLDTQYRMNLAICDFPSQQFYGGKLITETGAWYKNRRDAIWPRNEDGQVRPHIFIHVEGEEKVLTVSTEEGNEQSRSNEAEIYEVMEVFKYLTDQNLGTVKVLSQYNAQCSELRRLMREKCINFNDENICTVVSSQGGEWDYVIFSTVRSLKDYAIETSPTLGWCMKHLGFITDRNQINVALTRARKGLIIIGNKKLLRCDSTWSSLLKHYEKHGCVKQAGEFPPSGQTRSRQDIMGHNIRQSERRFGYRPYEAPPAATFYTGKFD
ncbi:helicase with zinc finger domain 2-like [Mya arenaria]|uniref:helicase with zinc finger domain 2-like n=1 Tax=Mya arenaria TaxID=6604 RepID=UPI0022DF4FA6|nr:helicase with zinc finger domain 2-like [Mya arenaria]